MVNLLDQKHIVAFVFHVHILHALLKETVQFDQMVVSRAPVQGNPNRRISTRLRIMIHDERADESVASVMMKVKSTTTTMRARLVG